jgi:hypothetical protein
MQDFMADFLARLNLEAVQNARNEGVLNENGLHSSA